MTAVIDLQRIENATRMNLLYRRIGGSEGISRLLRHFYAEVRQDPLIGPIFNAQIKDWKDHLEIIGNFGKQSSVATKLCKTNADEAPATQVRRRALRAMAISMAGKLSSPTAQ